MARGLIANCVSDKDGTPLPAATTGDAVNNHYFNNTGKTKMFVKNTGAGARIVTIKFTRTVSGQAITSITKSIAAGVTEAFGPYSVTDFGRITEVDVAHAELTLYTVD